jgi:hypothetical protein
MLSTSESLRDTVTIGRNIMKSIAEWFGLARRGYWFRPIVLLALMAIEALVLHACFQSASVLIVVPASALLADALWPPSKPFWAEGGHWIQYLFFTLLGIVCGGYAYLGLTQEVSFEELMMRISVVFLTVAYAVRRIGGLIEAPYWSDGA